MPRTGRSDSRDAGHAGDTAVPGVSLPFRDRADAGARLAEQLRELHLTEPLVLALPRGGVEVARELVQHLGGTLDVVLTRKIGYPPQPELGVGAVAEGGEPVFDDRILAHLGLSTDDLAETLDRERHELARRADVYRRGEPLPVVAGRDVVIVDDGIATGGTARAALRTVRARGPSRLILAVPVGAPDTAWRMEADADAVVILATPEDFRAVGQWYESFEQLGDDDVLALLRPPEVD